MEHFSKKVGEVADDVDKEGLDDGHMVGEAGNDGSKHTKQDADTSTTQPDHEERPHPGHDVRGDDIALPNMTEPLEHVVEDLEEEESKLWIFLIVLGKIVTQTV